MERHTPSVRPRLRLACLLASHVAAAAIALAFVSARHGGRTNARPAGVAGPTESSSSCVDARAMDANAVLVGDAQTCHGLLTRARADAARGAALEAASARSASSILRALAMSREDWIEGSRSGGIVLRSPCAAPRGRASTTVYRRGRTSIGQAPPIAGFVTSARTEASTLSPEETSALEDAYTRAHARTWAKMKTACAAIDGPDEEDDQRGRVDWSDAQRIGTCRGAAMHRADNATIGRVSELRTAGLPPSRGTEPEDVVILALAESTEELGRALGESLGVEKAARVTAYGSVCIDETFLFAPPPPRGEDPT